MGLFIKQNNQLVQVGTCIKTKEPIGYGPKIVPQQQTFYIRYGRDGNPEAESWPWVEPCSGSSNSACDLYIVYNDGRSTQLTTTDKFKISFDIPSILVQTLNLPYDSILNEYEFKDIYDAYGKTFYNVWVKTTHLLINGSDISVKWKEHTQFVSSTSSTTTLARPYKVDNWKLYLNNIEQQDVFGIKVINKTSASNAKLFDTIILNCSYNATTYTITNTDIQCLKDTPYKVYDNNKVGYFILNGIRTLDKGNAFYSNPLVELTCTNFKD